MRWWDFITEPKHANAIMAIFTMLIFVTGALYTVFAGLQWCANQKAADAAASAAKTAKDTLVLDQRPWVDGKQPYRS
jgi:hypothetical protein